MNHFFKVKSLTQVMALLPQFSAVGVERVPLFEAGSRVLAQDIHAHHDIPGFRRSTMDGYAVASGSTFGASEANPAWLTIVGSIAMGDVPTFAVGPGEAAKISTGGMLPEGADSVVMVEHTDPIDETTVEVYKSVAPLQYVVEKDEDFKKNQEILQAGTLIRPQESGLAASLGLSELAVYRRPKVGIISTGDEIVPITETPPPGKIRDINSYTLAGLIRQAGGEPLPMGIVKDNENDLFDACKNTLQETDMVLISGGSSVGVRDFTVDVLSSLDATDILVHGISISPGKPTILARSGGAPSISGGISTTQGGTATIKDVKAHGVGHDSGYEKPQKDLSPFCKPIWGLPGHVVSAMVVFQVVVLPFLKRLCGEVSNTSFGVRIPARLTRNVPSAQGRTDFIRVKLVKDDETDGVLASPVLGKSGLIRTMVMADGLLEIDENVEGVEKGALVNIIPMVASL